MRFGKVALVVLVLSLGMPAFALRDSEPRSFYDRLASLVQQLIVRTLVPNGDGAIPPIPSPTP